MFALLGFLGLGNSVTHGPAPTGLAPPSSHPYPAAPENPPATSPLPPIAPAALASAVEVLLAEVERGAFPGAALTVGVGERTLLRRGVGHIGWTPNAPAVSPDTTRYDLASLSKVVGTTAAVMLLVDDGRMRLDQPVQRYVPEFQGRGKEAVTIRHLLAHTSGLPAGTALNGSTPDEVARRLARTRIYSPPGARVEYSDIGFVLLWEAAERAAGEPLPGYLQRRLYKPLGMTATGYRPGLDCEACAPTGRLRDGTLYRGKPFDATARKLGGITGSSGLFSSSRDVGRFAAMIANGGELDGVRVLRPETVRRFARPAVGTRALGWEIVCREPAESPQEPCAEPVAIGHTGWTGTSLWIDPERGTWVALLTNRTYEPRAPSRIGEVRREVWERVTAGR